MTAWDSVRIIVLQLALATSSCTEVLNNFVSDVAALRVSISEMFSNYSLQNWSAVANHSS